jgi:undecaprenyl-diphosphatase
MTSLDARLLLWINQGWSHPWLDSIFRTLSATWGFSFPFFALLVALLFLKHRRDGLWLGLSLLLLIVAGDALGNLLKHLLAQPRPCFEMASMVRPPGPCGGGRWGMPSNHALNFFAATAFLGLALRSKGARAGMLLINIGVAISRVYLARHYPSQVLVGAALGIAFGVAGWMVVRRLPFARRLLARQLEKSPQRAVDSHGLGH